MLKPNLRWVASVPSALQQCLESLALYIRTTCLDRLAHTFGVLAPTLCLKLRTFHNHSMYFQTQINAAAVGYIKDESSEKSPYRNLPHPWLCKDYRAATGRTICHCPTQFATINTLIVPCQFDLFKPTVYRRASAGRNGTSLFHPI